MDILFLGTGSAWRLPEYSCGCMICKKMNELEEETDRNIHPDNYFKKDTYRPRPGSADSHESLPHGTP